MDQEPTSRNTPGAHNPARHEFSFITVISLAALAAAALLATFPFFRRIEAGSVDLRLNMRYLLTRGQITARPDIVFLALDNRTQSRMGMFRMGQWLVRKPYFDQLRFFNEYFRPTAVAYDLLFKDTIGESTGLTGRISESADLLDGISRAIQNVSAKAHEVVPSTVLSDLASFAAEQGDIFLSQGFATIAEAKSFPVIISFNFRGGWVDPKPTPVPAWSDHDIFGDDPSGEEDNGARLPYLLDIAIPDDVVHFRNSRTRDRSWWCPNANTPNQNLLDYALLGFINVKPDEDGIIRRIPLVLGFEYSNRAKGVRRTVLAPSFGLMATMLHLGIRFPLTGQTPAPIEVHLGHEIILRSPRHGEYHIPIDDDGQLYLNFDAKFEDYQSFSFADAAPSYLDTTEQHRDRLARSMAPFINGHLAFVGAVTTGHGDIGPCPLATQTPLVHVHATVAGNILNRSFLRPLPRGQQYLLAGFLFAVFTGICAIRRLTAVASAALLFTVLYLLAAYTGIHFHRLMLPVVWPMFYMALTLFGAVVYRYLAAERARLAIRRMFSTMVSADVLTYLEKNPASFSLAGHTAEATIMMTDVAGFTPISERLAPAQLTRLMNTYFTPITDSIMRHGGYVDKYVGDGVMAVWGAPNPNPQHALAACQAALEQQVILAGLNPVLQAEFGLQMHVRIGLNSGTVTAGNMGSTRRLQYTVMGDAVNLAKRLEAVNTDYSTRIIIGENTFRQVHDAMVTRWLDTIMVKGRSESSRIYELIGDRNHVTPATLTLIADYEEAVALFLRQEFTAALQILERLAETYDDKPSQLLITRIMAGLRRI